MIIYEQFYIKNRLFNRAYSDIGMLIYGGSPEAYYSEACDPADLHRTYTETDIPIPTEED